MTRRRRQPARSSVERQGAHFPLGLCSSSGLALRRRAPTAGARPASNALFGRIPFQSCGRVSSPTQKTRLRTDELLPSLKSTVAQILTSEPPAPNIIGSPVGPLAIALASRGVAADRTQFISWTHEVTVRSNGSGLREAQRQRELGCKGRAVRSTSSSRVVAIGLWTEVKSSTGYFRLPGPCFAHSNAGSGPCRALRDRPR
jgi:hypothetical protein